MRDAVAIAAVANESRTMLWWSEKWRTSQRVITVLRPKQLTFDELSKRLRAYESKYGYSTVEFYVRFEKGELGDDDDLMMWAGVYHLYLTSLPVRQFMKAETTPA